MNIINIMSKRTPSISLTRRRVLAGAVGLSIAPIAGGASMMAREPLPENLPLVIGHRGADGLAPPNTLKGIEIAREYGADGVEIDIRETADGELVLFHDPILNWATTGAGRVSEVSAEYLSTVRINGEPIPTLDAGLDRLVGTDMHTYLEIKKSGYTEKIIREVEDHNLLDSSTFVSFEGDALRPAIERGARTGLVGSVPNPKLIEDAVELGVDEVFAHYVPNAMPWFIKAAHEENLIAGIWSLVDTEHSIRDALESEPDVITVNRPDLVLEVLNRDGTKVRDHPGSVAGSQR